MTLLYVEALSVQYERERALSDVSFDLDRGTVLGVVGADGAGKTSLLRSVVGLLKPSAGRVHLNPGTRLGYVPQQFSLYGEMSLEENMSFFGTLNGLSRGTLKKRIDELLEFTGLAPFRNHLAEDLSGGMKQKLSLAVSLLHWPEFVVFDELTNGVDPVSRRELWELIGKVRQDGVAVLVSTQYLDEEERCDRVLLLHEGEKIRYGSPKELRCTFPYTLWALPDSGKRRMELELLTERPGIVNVYARGNDTVLAVDDEQKAQESLEKWKCQAEYRGVVEERKPSMEDVFIALVEKGEGTRDDSSASHS